MTLSNNYLSHKVNTGLYLRDSSACVCSRYNVRSDWLILGYFSPVMLIGQSGAYSRI